MVREKLKAGGESKAVRLRGKSRTCYNIVIIGWGQGSASFLCIRSWGLFGDTEGGPLLDSYWLTAGGGKKKKQKNSWNCCYKAGKECILVAGKKSSQGGKVWLMTLEGGDFLAFLCMF